MICFRCLKWTDIWGLPCFVLHLQFLQWIVPWYLCVVCSLWCSETSRGPCCTLWAGTVVTEDGPCSYIRFTFVVLPDVQKECLWDLWLLVLGSWCMAVSCLPCPYRCWLLVLGSWSMAVSCLPCPYRCVVGDEKSIWTIWSYAVGIHNSCIHFVHIHILCREVTSVGILVKMIRTWSIAVKC